MADLCLKYVEVYKEKRNRNCLGQFREMESEHGLLYNAGDKVTLTLYNVTLTS